MEAIRRMRELNVYFNEFTGKFDVNCPLPWAEAGPRQWLDYDSNKLTEYFQNQDIPFKPNTVRTAVETVATERARHPLREWLEEIRWDGKDRLDGWLTYCLGAPDTEYTRAVGAAWCISAVARVFEPGCKADYVLVLEGAQGIGKSTALRVLAGNEYFTDELPPLGTKDAALQLRGSWIIELAELDTVRRADVSVVKAFLTSTIDKYRPPYAHTTIEVPRQCVFAGTVNDVEWLADVDNRRFWPVPTPACDVSAVEAEREQIWAEAVYRYRIGEKWWIIERGIAKKAREMQDSRRLTDAWGPVLDRYLAQRDDTSIGEILSDALGIRPERWEMVHKTRVGRHLVSQRVWRRYKATLNQDDIEGKAIREYRYQRVRLED